MKSHVANAAFGVVDYLAYPVGMLLLAPIILRSLGMERYGIWALAGAVLNTGAVIASGFGDANIRSVAMALGSNNRSALLDAVRSTLGIHLVLGLVIAAISWLAAPALAHSAVKNNGDLTADCLWSLRITAILIFLRTLETVCVSTLRAFARYGAAIKVSVCARFLTLAAAGLVPFYRRSVSAILIVALIISAIALWIQFRQLNRSLSIPRLSPLFRRAAMGSLLAFGIFTWLQSVAGLLFGQVDRIIAGAAFGATAVSSYSFCVQLSQPIYGITAAGLHFLFPHLAAHNVNGSAVALRRSVLGAFTANLVFVAIAAALLLEYGTTILRVWGGAAVAESAGSLLPVIAWSSALSALSVTGCYSLLALGKPRSVTALTLIGGVAMVAAIPCLIPRFGLAGIAYGRLFFGPPVLLVYVPLLFMMCRSPQVHLAAAVAQSEEV